MVLRHQVLAPHLNFVHELLAQIVAFQHYFLCEVCRFNSVGTGFRVLIHLRKQRTDLEVKFAQVAQFMQLVAHDALLCVGVLSRRRVRVRGESLRALYE